MSGTGVSPDGGPLNLGSSTSVPTQGGAFRLWDIPTELTDYLNATSAGKLFFDIGQRQTTTTSLADNPLSEPGVVGATGPGSVQYTPGSANAAEHDVTKSTKTEAYNIMSKPWQVMAQFQAMQYNDPVKFQALQQALAASPFGTVHLNGVFDHNTEVALGNAMLQYVKLSMGTGAVPIYTDPKTGKKSGGFVGYLLSSAATAQANGGGGTSLGGVQNQITLADPAQIREQAQNAAQQALGHGLSEKELEAFVTQFQNQQIANQTDSYTQQSKLPAEAMAFVQSHESGDFKANQRTSYLDQLVNLLGGSVTSRPNQQPVAAMTP